MGKSGPGAWPRSVGSHQVRLEELLRVHQPGLTQQHGTRVTRVIKPARVDGHAWGGRGRHGHRVREWDKRGGRGRSEAEERSGRARVQGERNFLIDRVCAGGEEEREKERGRKKERERGGKVERARAGARAHS